MSTTQSINPPTRSGDNRPQGATFRPPAPWDALAAEVDSVVADKAAEYAPTPEPQRRPRFARFRDTGRHHVRPGTKQFLVSELCDRTVQLRVTRQGAL